MSSLPNTSTKSRNILALIGHLAIFATFSIGYIVPGTRNSSFTPLLVFALGTLIIGKKQKFAPSSDVTRYILVAITAFSVIYFIDAGRDLKFGRSSETGARILAAWIFYLYMRKAKISLVSWYLSLSAAIIGSLVIAIYQTVIQDHDRAFGFTNSVVFGQSISAMSALITTGLWQEEFPSRLKAWLAIVAVGGCFVVLLSGTRGAWPIIFLVIFSIFSAYRTGTAFKINKVGMVLAFALLVPLGIAAYKHADIGERIEKIYQEARNFEKDPYAPTSVGTRLLMWEFAWDLFKQRPLLGWGNSEYQEKRHLEIESGRGNNQFGEHAHNEILNTLAKFGMLGAIALMISYLSPIFLALKTRGHLISTRQKGLWLSLFMLPSVYFITGLTDTPLRWTDGISIYFYSFALLCGVIAREIQPQNKFSVNHTHPTCH